MSLTVDGSSALDSLYWRAEILQAMYWMRGEGIASRVSAAQLVDFLVADRDVLITTDGTVYSVSGQPSGDGLTSSLVLSVQPAGGKEVLTTLPESTGAIS